MLNQSLLDKFELIEVKSVDRSTGRITINKDKNTFNISTKYIKQLDWKNNERVNLRGYGGTFALVPDKVGLIKVHINNNGGIITSVNFCLEVLSRTKSCRVFEGWVEDNVLFFRPKEGEEDVR